MIKDNFNQQQPSCSSTERVERLSLHDYPDFNVQCIVPEDEPSVSIDATFVPSSEGFVDVYDFSHNGTMVSELLNPIAFADPEVKVTLRRDYLPYRVTEFEYDPYGRSNIEFEPLGEGQEIILYVSGETRMSMEYLVGVFQYDLKACEYKRYNYAPLHGHTLPTKGCEVGIEIIKMYFNFSDGREKVIEGVMLPIHINPAMIDASKGEFEDFDDDDYDDDSINN